MDAAENNQTPTGVSNDRRVSSPPHSLQPLAPLEYLQNQRRGSITDPSLHALPSDPALNHHYHYPHHSQQQQQPVLAAEQRVKRSPRTIRPTSPFVFGDASINPPDPASPTTRRHLRSPSNETIDPSRSPDRFDDSSRIEDIRASSVTPDYRKPHDNGRSWHKSSNHPDQRFGLAMDGPHRSTEEVNSLRSRSFNLSGPASAASLPPPPFDYSMRRHSIAEHPVPRRGISQPSDVYYSPSQSPTIPPLHQSLKRKMSPDRALYPMDEEDPVHPAPLDIHAPAPKRRGSAIDPHRIAQLTLNDRRDSMDARIPPGQPQQWWLPERRDTASASSMFSNATMGTTSGYAPSGFSTDFPPRQNVTNMTWQSSHPTPANHEAEAPLSGLPRHLHPRASIAGDETLPSFPPIPPGMPVDRRMSVPELSSAASSQRNLRARSRPPQITPAHTRMSERQSSTNPSETDGMAEDSETSPTQPHMLPPPPPVKEGTSPYSRSPELRVSHKLAERKRRKEMKDLFDELRDHLPADRGMKASKWEILTKAVEYIQTLKTAQQELSREVEILRQELEVTRAGHQFQSGMSSNHSHGYATHMNNAFNQSQNVQPHQHTASEAASTT